MTSATGLHQFLPIILSVGHNRETDRYINHSYHADYQHFSQINEMKWNNAVISQRLDGLKTVNCHTYFGTETRTNA